MDETVTNRWIEPAESTVPAETHAPAAAASTPAAQEPLAFAFLVQIAEELNSTLELDQVLEKVARRVKEHVNYDTFAILLLDDLGQELRFRFALGFSPEVVDHWRFGLGQGLVGTAAQARQPIRVSDVQTDGRYIRADERIRSELAIPLIIQNRPIGVLDVASYEPNYFTEEHERLLAFLAGHLANAIENARLYENLREQARTLSLLHEVSRELTSILDREQLLRRVAKLVKRLINYQGFAVLVWNEQTQLLEHTFSLRYDERLCPKGGLPLGYGLCGTAAALRQPLRVPNVTLDPRHVRCNHQAHEAEVRSELVVPLVFKDRLVGVLDLESTEYNAFTEQHEQMLSTLASYVAIALENARLYERLRESEQRLAGDLATAREIQRSLLPEAPPRLPGLDIGTAYEPARQLGGDVYDFLPYGDGHLAVAVGDVAGKATAAALYGSVAIGMLRGHVVVHPCPPAEMLELMNRHLHQPRLDKHFIALLLSVYEASTRTLTVANAGFPRPLLVRGGRLETISIEGVPLGLLPDSRYEEKQLQLEPGDVIVFCSDGIQDSMNRRQEEFGAKRLKRTLTGLARKGSAAEIAQELLRATDRHANDTPEPTDDRTVVVLKVTTPRG